MQCHQLNNKLLGYLKKTSSSPQATTSPTPPSHSEQWQCKSYTTSTIQETQFPANNKSTPIPLLQIPSPPPTQTPSPNMIHFPPPQTASDIARQRELEAAYTSLMLTPTRSILITIHPSPPHPLLPAHIRFSVPQCTSVNSMLTQISEYVPEDLLDFVAIETVGRDARMLVEGVEGGCVGGLLGRFDGGEVVLRLRVDEPPEYREREGDGETGWKERVWRGMGRRRK